jgi:hypothetical protein
VVEDTTPLAPEPAAPKAVKLDLTSNMPDMVTDTDKYNAELEKRLAAYERGQKEMAQYEANATKTREDRINGLWSTFSDKYEAYADDFDGVETVATIVVERAAKAGKDVDKYMYGPKSTFMADVVAEYDKRLGKPQIETDDDDDDEDDGRAAGIPGGFEAGGKPTESQPRAGTNSKSIASSIHDWQLKTGFHS